MPIEPITALALGYIVGRLLGSSDSDNVRFAQPFLVRVETATMGLGKNEYVTAIGYLSNTERKELAGMQRGGAIEVEFKAKYVEDVGDIGDGPNDWMYYKEDGKWRYRRINDYGDVEEVIEEPESAYDRPALVPRAKPPRYHDVYGDKGSVPIKTSY